MRLALRKLLACAVLALAVAASPAHAQKRVALVIGNANYTNVPVLANPANDAADLARSLEALSFEVVLGIDLTRNSFAQRLMAFGDRIGRGDETIFFYAGHGLQAKGINYLIPVDAKLDNERDLDFEAVPVDLVLRQVRVASTKIVVLDACRNNPFAKSLARSMGVRSMSETMGLAVTVASDLGTFIAYATQPGNVASDGHGRNSPFTAKLLAHIATPGQSISDMMMVVRNDVAAVTGGAQIPWEHSALSTRFVFRAGKQLMVSREDQLASDAAEAWGWIRNTTNRALFEEFVRRYGTTPFADTAKQALAALEIRPQATTGTFVPNIANVALRPVQPSFDCRQHYGDAEVTICNSPELAILDNELSRLYVGAYDTASETRKSSILSAQRQWLMARNACGVDVTCISNAYRTRLAALGSGHRGIVAPVAKTNPSFDCAKHDLPAEVAVCSNPGLAELDVQLHRRYTATSNALSGDKRRELVLEQRQWLRARDTCGSDQPCLSLQYQARIEQLRVRR